MVELFRLEDSVQHFFMVSSKNYVKAYYRMYLCENLSLGMFLGCSYFFTISEADVLINSVLRQNTACRLQKGNIHLESSFKAGGEQLLGLFTVIKTQFCLFYHPMNRSKGAFC